jgi:choline dehydrogenase-like flavoprotein
MSGGTIFDYVVAGTGSAGCTLAYRLTEDPAVKVLVIDAGGWECNWLETHDWRGFAAD